MLFASGTVSALGALTVDVGLIYAERAQLQTAADAAAIAVAKVCALRRAQCNAPDMLDEARRYAGDNVKDAAVEISAVCGAVRIDVPLSRPGPIHSCPAPAGNLTRCLGSASATGEYIEVRVRTERPGGSTALPPAFAGALTATDGVTVGACARATWQAVSTVTGGLPVVMSDCVVRKTLDDHGRQPAPTGGGHLADVDAEVKLPFRSISPGSPAYGYCRSPGWPRRSNATDGFAGEVLGADPAPCSESFTVGGVHALQGGGGDADRFWGESRRRPKPRGCFPRLNELVESKTPVPVAVYRPDRTGRAYVESVRGFVVTGWYRMGWPDRKPARPGPDDRWNMRSTLTGQTRCAPTGGFTSSCLFGYFTDDPAGGGAAGPSSIRIIG
ncbi:hypothetical protein J2S41_006777 [Catenuloplanes atrovinosus]|uniref:Putative Flp pilus-assembly TadG-like N-terminal domain-containing protein n=2 Tax=Catenuloplanes atrovinosus TaxID=137266 RepID=A0AAE3YXF4_9ACTN|nr:hypothetical protein [Catenuloplanes atrovinosus]